MTQRFLREPHQRTALGATKVILMGNRSFDLLKYTMGPPREQARMHHRGAMPGMSPGGFPWCTPERFPKSVPLSRA